MSTIVKVKASSFFWRNGKLISRKSYRRILGNKLSLTQAKNRVKALHSALDKLRQLTKLDKDNLEYAIAVNKVRKQGKVNIIKGELIEQNGRKIPTVDLPKVNNESRYWYVHSHPDPIPLSLGDITYPKSNKGMVFAIDPEGSVYRARRLSNDPVDTSMMIYEYNNARRTIRDKGLIKQSYNNAIRSEILMEDNEIKKMNLIK